MIKRITELLIQFLEIDISSYEESFIEKSINKKMDDARCGSLEDYFELLKISANERSILIDSLKNSYSEFFRNPLSFSVLEKLILPQLAAKLKNKSHGELRIWSAACASGQEVYSLAMLLEEMRNISAEHFSYRIFATDKSEEQISKAQAGFYTGNDLNNVTMRRTKRWFTKQGENYSVIPELKQNIHYSVFDLFDENLSAPPASIFGDFDLVLCANILFYYRSGHKDMILKKVRNSLSVEGILLTGESERDILLSAGFREVYPQSAIFRG